MNDEQRSRQRRICRKEGLLSGLNNATQTIRTTFRAINNEIVNGDQGIDEIIAIQRYTTACLIKLESEKRAMEKDLDKEYKELRQIDDVGW